MPIPPRRTITCYSNRHDQQRIILEIVQVKGVDEAPTSLGHSAFPIEHPAQNHPLEVTFGYDVQGIVTVTARDPETNHAVRREFGAGEGDRQSLAEQNALVDSVPFCD
jgi:molecular chaperone DnaK